MSLNTNAVCQLEDVINYANLSDKVSENNDLIENLINRVTEIFHNYCGIEQFMSKEYTEYLDGVEYQAIRPINYPIISVDSIYDSIDWDWDEDALISTDYYMIHNNKRIIVLKDTYLNISTQNIKITYTAGYATIPLDIVQAAVEEVKVKFTGRDKINFTTNSTESTSVTYREWDLLPSTKRILDKYVNLRIL